MAPIRKGDGTPLEIPGVSEVRSGDGRVFFGAIPDSEVYLQDDWGDNRLTDREDSGTTTYNGVEGVYRPEWGLANAFSNLPTVSNERLQLTDDDEGIVTEINLNLDETVTWQFTGIDVSNSGTSGGDTAHFGLWAEQQDSQTSGRLNESYSVSVRNGDTVRLEKMDADGNFDDFIIGSSISGSDNSVTVSRTPSGEWELFVDGSSDGTATDTEFLDPVFAYFSGREGDRDIDITLDEVKVN